MLRAASSIQVCGKSKLESCNQQGCISCGSALELSFANVSANEITDQLVVVEHASGVASQDSVPGRRIIGR